MREIVGRALAEDIGAGDLTSAAVVPAGARASAAITAKAPGVLAGVDVAAAVFTAVDPELTVTSQARDGERLTAGGRVFAIEGAARAILAGERVALNFLGRLSGVATLTARYVEAVAGTGVRILDTRKTTPGLRELEKAAVRAGGGHSHRAGLYDAILVKENHVRSAGGVAQAARLALANAPAGVTVEIEVESLAELDDALDAGAERVLLDELSLADMRVAVQSAAGRATLEASGGVTLETARAIAETGVDFISVGALTHSAAALDLSLLFDPA